jgi:Acyl-CoA reductase (LuxC)
MSTPVFKAGYLPGLQDADVSWHRLRLGTPQAPLDVDVPQLTADQMAALAARIRESSQAQLKTMAVSDIVTLLDAAVARLLDNADPYHQQLQMLLPLATGFDGEMLRLSLNAYLQTFRGLQLRRFIAQDFANPLLLDAFQPQVSGGWAKAFGPELLVHVWAGNVPALPLWSLVSGLLVKAGSIGKIASAEPIFASLFARLLAEVEPRWADCLAVVWWQGGDAAQERQAFELADVVLAYGGNAALHAMQAHVPITTRFLPHGHKLSFGVVSAAALSTHKGPMVARQAALDVARYDQQGCYSPHVFYVQRGGSLSPLEFAQHLAHALAAVQHKMPRQVLSLEEAAQVGAWREAHEFAALGDRSRTVLGSPAQWGSVVYAEQALPLTPGPLNRCVLVVAVDGLDEVMPLVAPQRDFLQTVGVAAAPEELLAWGERLGQAGVTRLCALGAMTAPEAGWHHDGRFSLLDLVRMVDIDAGAEREAERFTSYAP